MDSALISEYKQKIIEAGRFVTSCGVMSISKHGNISARLPGEDAFLLTAGGTLSELRPENIALYELDGTLVEGAVEPTSAEIVDMHGVVYRLRPDAGGALHTHSPAATSLAVAYEPIPLIYEAMARFDMTDGVPLAGYGPRGSSESVDNIARAIRENPNTGGVLAFAADPVSSVRANVVIEEAAILFMNARAVGKANPIPANMVEQTRQRRDDFASMGVQRAG